MTVTLRQMEYVVAVFRHGSFRAAADACHVSQPALSTQIQQVETFLGTKLFERNPRQVLPTHAGEAFAKRAEGILVQVEDLLTACRDTREPLAGDLRLGTIPTVGPYLLPQMLCTFRDAFPSCRLLLTERHTDQLVRQLQEGSLDILLLALEAELGNVRTEPLFRDAFHALVPASHAAEPGTPIGLEELLGENLLLLEEGHCLSQQVHTLCGSNELELGDFRASSLSTLVHMVALGVGVTLIPELAIQQLTTGVDGVRVHPLREEAFRTIGLVWRSGSPREHDFQRFAEYVESKAPEEGA